MSILYMVIKSVIALIRAKINWIAFHKGMLKQITLRQGERIDRSSGSRGCPSRSSRRRSISSKP